MQTTDWAVYDIDRGAMRGNTLARGVRVSGRTGTQTEAAYGQGYVDGAADGMARAVTIIRARATEYRERLKRGESIQADFALRSLVLAVNKQRAIFEEMASELEGGE